MSIDDPLSISNSDNPNAQLTQLLFDGSNFVTWSRQLRRALGAKMKIGFLTGVVAKPSPDSKDLPRWTRCDEMDLLSRNLVAEGRARGGLYTLLATQKDVVTASNKPAAISRASVEPVDDGIASVVGEDSLGSSEVVDHGIVPIRQSTRTRHAPAWTADYVLQSSVT
ncbi:hypothetical protein V2J09_015420 [Rumex salicifolius]